MAVRGGAEVLKSHSQKKSQVETGPILQGESVRPERPLQNYLLSIAECRFTGATNGVPTAFSFGMGGFCPNSLT